MSDYYFTGNDIGGILQICEQNENYDGDPIEMSVFHLSIKICSRTSLNMRLMVLVQITFMMLDLVLMDDLRQHGTGVTN